MKKLFMLALVLTAVITGLFCVRILINNKYIIDNYTLHYYTSYYRYDLITKRNKIVVNKNEMAICFVAPCPERLVDKRTIYLNEKYIRFFKNVFSDGTNEKNISRNDLSESDYIILKKITQMDDALTYKVLTPSNYSTYKVRGYYEINGGTYVIASGENIKGINIKIIRVEISRKNVILYISESKNNVNIKGRLSAPVAVIEFSEKPEKIIVKNIDTGEEFNKIN